MRFWWLIKIIALTVFVLIAVPAAKSANLEPFLPGGWGNPISGGVGVLGAAASIFFAYVGFDAVSTAAEETKNPQRNIPIGLIASLLICTAFYLLVGYGAAGSIGAQPMLGANGLPLDPGTPEMMQACVRSPSAGVQQRAARACDARARFRGNRQLDRHRRASWRCPP